MRKSADGDDSAAPPEGNVVELQTKAALCERVSSGTQRGIIRQYKRFGNPPMGAIQPLLRKATWSSSKRRPGFVNASRQGRKEGSSVSTSDEFRRYKRCGNPPMAAIQPLLRKATWSSSRRRPRFVNASRQGRKEGSSVSTSDEFRRYERCRNPPMGAIRPLLRKATWSSSKRRPCFVNASRQGRKEGSSVSTSDEFRRYERCGNPPMGTIQPLLRKATWSSSKRRPCFVNASRQGRKEFSPALQCRESDIIRRNQSRRDG